MSDVNSADVLNGVYAAYMSGIAGVSVAVLLIKDGVIAGADAGDGIYDGHYKILPDGNYFEGSIRFSMPPGLASITGVSSGDTPLEFDVPVKLPIAINPEETYRIETPAGPVNTKFKKIRSV